MQGIHSQTSVLLANLHAYYIQYLPHAEVSLKSGLEPVEKHLKVILLPLGIIDFDCPAVLPSFRHRKPQASDKRMRQGEGKKAY